MFAAALVIIWYANKKQNVVKTTPERKSAF